MKHSHFAKFNTLVNMVRGQPYQIVTPEVRAYIKVSQGLKSASTLQLETEVSRATIYRIWATDVKELRQKGKSTGRPSKLDDRATRNVLRQIPKMRQVNYNWSIGELMQAAGVEQVHRCTVNRRLNKNGFRHLQMRKKGILSAKDKKLRLRFARSMLRRPDSSTYWINGISFYLDAVSFVYKSNPRANAAAPSGRCFRRQSEGLTATAKGSVCGTGGKYVRVIACISHGGGVIWASTYDKMTGESFAEFVSKNFNTIFERSGKKSKDVYVWLQDGDKCQNSKKAKDAMKKVHANCIQSIPPRSPDLNPIENVFNVVKADLRREAITKDITHETLEEYTSRVLESLRSYPVDVINRTIESMEKRLKLVWKGRGNRTKY